MKQIGSIEELIKQREKIRNDVECSLLNNIEEYIDLYEDSSCLDGWFTANDLRRIADAMDEVKKLIEAGNG